MEIWDILDENGERTGRTMLRSEKIKPGDYYLAVHIWIINSKGEYLIQKRAEDKSLWPGMWAATGGAAVSGESSLEAALREVEEELGFRPNPNNLNFLERIKRKDWFTDLWILRQDIGIESIIMQLEEVCDVLWATKEEILQMVQEKRFVNYSYLIEFLSK